MHTGVQVANYLGSDPATWAHEFWDTALRPCSDAEELQAIKLLHQQPEDVMLAVYEAHPLLTSKQALSTQLQTLPRLAHVAACMHAIEDHWVYEDSHETPLGPFLAVDLQQPWIATAVADALPQVLRRRPDTGVALRPPTVQQRPHDAEAHAVSALASLTALRTLSLAWADCGSGSVGRKPAWLQCDYRGVSQLPPALRNLTGLERLSISMPLHQRVDNQPGFAGMALQPLLAGCPQVTLLHFDGCELRSEDVREMDASMSAMTALRDLHISEDHTSSIPLGPAPLCSVLSKLAVLTKLSMSGNTAPSCTRFWSAIAQLRSLQQLHVVYGDFWRCKCEPVPGLAQLTALTWLSTDEGGRIHGANAASALSQLVSLQQLDLCCDSLGADADHTPELDTGLCAVAPALACLTAVTVLKLLCCFAGKLGCAALGQGLAGMSALQKVELGCVALSRLAAGLKSSLCSHAALKKVEISPYHGSRTTKKELKALCFPNRCKVTFFLPEAAGSDEYGSYSDYNGSEGGIGSDFGDGSLSGDEW